MVKTFFCAICLKSNDINNFNPSNLESFKEYVVSSQFHYSEYSNDVPIKCIHCKNSYIHYFGELNPEDPSQLHGSAKIYQDIEIDGKIIDGIWKNGVPTKGSYFYKNGNIYQGQLFNFLPNGYGKLINAKGELIHEGEWQDGLHSLSDNKIDNKSSPVKQFIKPIF